MFRVESCMRGKWHIHIKEKFLELNRQQSGGGGGGGGRKSRRRESFSLRGEVRCTAVTVPLWGCFTTHGWNWQASISLSVYVLQSIQANRVLVRSHQQEGHWQHRAPSPVIHEFSEKHIQSWKLPGRSRDVTGGFIFYFFFYSENVKRNKKVVMCYKRNGWSI